MSDHSEVADRITIRSARADDGAAVWPLAKALATSFAPERAAFDRVYGDILADERAALLVAVIDAQVVGYVHVLAHPAFHANGPVGWVEELIVAVERRGTGIGRRLMRTAEAWAHEHGAAYLAVATRRAANFYRAIGYQESASYFRTDLETRDSII